MKSIFTFVALVGLAATTAAVQQTRVAPEPGAALKIEGEITSLFLMATPGPPSLTVKDKDGKEYIVHFGPLAPLRRQGFDPKVGDAITVSGTACCEMDNKVMVHSKEITLAGKTFRTPVASQQMMRMQPGCCEQGSGEGCPGCAQDMPSGNGRCLDCSNHEMHHGVHH